MYLYVLYLVVYFVNGVDPRVRNERRGADGAAAIAKLINFVQKVDNFQEIPPNFRYIGDGKGIDADDPDLFQSMKLLQKNYDTGRRLNEIVNEPNVQYISNPEVLEAFKNLPQEQPEVDSRDHADTPRSYVEELERLDRVPMHLLGRARRGDDEKPEKGLNETTESETDDSEKKNDAEEDQQDDKRRKIEENQEHGDSAVASEETITIKSGKAFDLVKPIIEQMLTEFKLNASLERDMSTNKEMEVKNFKAIPTTEHKTIEIQTNNEDNIDSKSRENMKNKIKLTNIVKKSNLNIPKQKKETENLSSEESKKKENLNTSPKTQRSTEDNNKKENRDLSNENVSRDKNSFIDPIITIEDNNSLEKHVNYNKKGQIGDNGSNNKHKSEKNKNIDSTETVVINSKLEKNENQISPKSGKTEGAVDMDETVIDWADYDEKQKTNEQESKVKESKNNNRKKENPWENADIDREKISESGDNTKTSSKRKTDDDWEEKNFDDGIVKKINWNKKDSNKKNSWDKKDDWNKKEISWDTKDDWNKKGDRDKNNGWNKQNDWSRKDDEKSKDDGWNKKENWNKNNDWDKKDNWNKNRERNKKYDRNKDENSPEKKDTWNKERDNSGEKNDWNKKNYDNWNNNDDKNRERWNKKDYNWNKRHDDWDTKKESSNRYKSDRDSNERDKTSKARDNIKRDSAWDNVGTNKNQNSGWGNYEVFKNIQDKKDSYERDNGGLTTKRKTTKRDITVKNRMSWNSEPSKRDDYNEKQRNQGRISGFRTHIPFAGKKAVYD